VRDGGIVEAPVVLSKKRPQLLKSWRDFLLKTAQSDCREPDPSSILAKPDN